MDEEKMSFEEKTLKSRPKWWRAAGQRDSESRGDREEKAKRYTGKEAQNQGRWMLMEHHHSY